MKSLQRYCYVFLCAVLLSIGCSSIVNADETKLENLKVQIITEIYEENTLFVKPANANITIYPNNKEVEKASVDEGFLTDGGSNWFFRTYWKFSNKDGNLLFRGGQKTNLILENGYYNIGYTVHNSNTMDVISTTYIRPHYNRALIEYFDGTFEYIEIEANSGNPTTIHAEFTPQKDVKTIQFQLNSSKIDFTASLYYTYWCHVGEQVSDNSFNLIIDTESVEAGLLSGIIGWIKNIYDTIVNLPSKIWEFISEGLKSLFIPSEEYLTQFKDNMNNMLSEKLGAIWQVVNILFEGWDRIQSNDSTNTIDFPSVTIPLPNDNEFTFGGQSVQIVPEGFDFLATAIKTITGVCCTVLFVNGLKKRYDDIMGG